MECVEVPISKQRLRDKKKDLAKRLAESYNPDAVAVLRMKLYDVEKAIRAYNRTH